MRYDIFSTAARGGPLRAESTPEPASQAKETIILSRIVSTDEGLRVEKCTEANLPVNNLTHLRMKYGGIKVSLDHFVSQGRRLNDSNLEELLTPGASVVAIPLYNPQRFKYQGEVSSGEGVVEKAVSLSLPIAESHLQYWQLILATAHYSSRKSPPAVILSSNGCKMDASDCILDAYAVLCRLNEIGHKTPILFVGRERITDVNIEKLMQPGVEIDCIEDPFMGWLSLYSQACKRVIEHPRPCLADLVSLLANGLAELILEKRHFMAAVDSGSYGDQPTELTKSKASELVGKITEFKELLTPSTREGLDKTKLPLILRASELLDQASQVVSQKLGQNIADWPSKAVEEQRSREESLQKFGQLIGELSCPTQ